MLPSSTYRKTEKSRPQFMDLDPLEKLEISESRCYPKFQVESRTNSLNGKQDCNFPGDEPLILRKGFFLRNPKSHSRPETTSFKQKYRNNGPIHCQIWPRSPAASATRSAPTSTNPTLENLGFVNLTLSKFHPRKSHLRKSHPNKLRYIKIYRNLLRLTAKN